jgi:hypothetical protein
VVEPIPGVLEAYREISLSLIKLAIMGKAIVDNEEE